MTVDDWRYAERHNVYHIYSKGRGAYKNFHASNAALIRWRRLFESWTRQSIILTTVLLFSVLICYRIFDFDCIRAAAHIWVNTVFKFNPLNNMYQYNCIFFWASREEKQLFWTLVRLDFLKVLRFSFPLCRRKQQKNSRFRFVLEKNLKLAQRVGKFTVRRVQLKHRTVGNSLFDWNSVP